MKFLAVAVLSYLTVSAASADPIFLAQLSSNHIDRIARSVAEGSRLLYVVVRNKAYSRFDLEERLAQRLYGRSNTTFYLDAGTIQTASDIAITIGHLHVDGLRKSTALGGFLKTHQDRGGLIAINNLTNSPIHQLLLQRINRAMTSTAPSWVDLSRFTFVFTSEDDFNLGSSSNVSAGKLAEHATISASEANRLDYSVLSLAALRDLLPCEGRLTGAIQAAE